MGKQKNVLMICTDHWAGSYLGCEGRRDIMTPTLDYLANNGVRFSNMYSECPVCIPARRTMMTGLLPRTHGDRVYSDHMPMPDVTTLAQAFRNAGYQTTAVGKLHVYPQRNRIGFDDALIMEEARYEFGNVDDYQIWLGENGYLGKEFQHGMGNNNYLTRPWHLDEEAHSTSWITTQMMKQIKRKDPTRPAFYFCSYAAPHPPLVPPQVFWDMYADTEFQAPHGDDWMDDRYIFRALGEHERIYSEKEKQRAYRGFFAQCTQIDYSIRKLIGTLRECNLLDDTLIVFLSDHGDMLFNHNLVAKRCFYEESTRVPFILAGKPVEHLKGTVISSLAEMADVMPTILDICGVEIPDTVEGIPLLAENVKPHDYVYGEVSEGNKATRMIRKGDYKLIYYPCGNILQLFDLEKDPDEAHDCAADPALAGVLEELKQLLLQNLYGKDLDWIRDGELVGFPAPEYQEKADYGLYNQRGYHWPAPSGYSNIGKNA